MSLLILQASGGAEQSEAISPWAIMTTVKIISYHSKKPLFVTVIILLVIGLLVYFFGQTRFNSMSHISSVVTSTSHKENFPDIDTSSLSKEQKQIVSLLEQEFRTQPNGTKYSEGVNEAWCADFVSWIMKQSGQPLNNPNSGSWRIPGTYTLREYYQSVGKFKPASANYTPKVGDTMLYDNPSPFGQHVNFVIKNTKGVITTIGGNEPGGIRVYTHTIKDDAGFIGYGVL